MNKHTITIPYNNIVATGLRGEQLRAFLEENL